MLKSKAEVSSAFVFDAGKSASDQLGRPYSTKSEKKGQSRFSISHIFFFRIFVLAYEVVVGPFSTPGHIAHYLSLLFRDIAWE